MKTVLLRCQVMWVLTVFVFCAQNVVAQEQSGKVKECSNSTLHGTFGYSSTGTLLPSYVQPPYAGPFAEVGRQTFDGKGNTDATATITSNGNVNKVTIEGTYAVNRDCTGSMTLNIPGLGATIHEDFVLHDDGTALRAIVTDSGVIVTKNYARILGGRARSGDSRDTGRSR